MLFIFKKEKYLAPDYDQELFWCINMTAFRIG